MINWISVEDKLPLNTEDIIFATGHNSFHLFFGFYSPTRGFVVSEGDYSLLSHVIYWGKKTDINLPPTERKTI